jgi:hypothetical protein
MATLLVGAMAVIWVVLARRQSHFLYGLFATAPWAGLYVVLQWQLDLFKVGLLFVPLMLVRARTVGRNRTLLILTASLGLLAAVHLCWQLGSQEIEAYDVVHSLSTSQRLSVAFTMFVLRLVMFLFVIAAVRSLAVAQSCLRWYCNSLFVLGCYGIIQEVVYLLWGDIITPIYRAGVLNPLGDYQAVMVGPVSVLRINSFCGEPKDFALFVTPAIVYLGHYILQETRTRARLMAIVQLIVITTAAFLTLASSLLLMMPIILVVIVMLSARGMRRARIALLALAMGTALWPVWSMFSEVRIFERFQGFNDLLQISRERPALHFWLEHMPRSFLGFAVGGQAYYVPANMPLGFMREAIKLGHSVGIDSFWLSMLFDLGIPGLTITVVIIASTIFHRRMTDRPAAPLRGAAIAAALISIPLQGDIHSAILWLMAGAAAGVTTGPGPRHWMPPSALSMNAIRPVPLKVRCESQAPAG